MAKTLLERFTQGVVGNDADVVFKAHGDLETGDLVLIAVATGVSEASGAGTTAKLNAIVLEDVAENAEGRARIMPNVTVATAVAALM